MRIESSVTSLSWIPSEAISGMSRLPFTATVAQYDEAPPERLSADPATRASELVALRHADRFRFANRMAAWIEVEDGQIVGHGHSGGGLIGSTTMRLGQRSATFTAVALPDRTSEPEVGDSWVRFCQSAGGRTGVPMPRHVDRAPFLQIDVAWSTLTLTLYANGRVVPELVGASPFPRHCVYDHAGRMVAKTGLIDFKDWDRNALRQHSPWGDEDSPALVTEMELALERQLASHLMRGSEKPKVRKLRPGATLVKQGDAGNDMFLLLDGVLAVDVDGAPMAELGPGALLGERAGLDGRARTSTLRAITRCKVACSPSADVDPRRLAELSLGLRREAQAG